MYLKRLRFAVCTIASSLMLIYGCKSTTVTPVSPLSDLTRSGKFISFTSNRDGGRYNIFLAQIENGNLASSGLVYASNPYDLTQNFNSVDKQSNWSPDGRILVFSSKQGDNSEAIYAYFFSSNGRIDSTKSNNPKKLFEPGMNWDENPQFSPDGSRLTWDRRSEDTALSRDIFIGNVASDSSGISISNIQNLTNTSGSDEYDPKWAPRNLVNRIAFTYATSATAFDHEIHIMDPANPGNQTVFYNPNRDGYPAWAPACDRIIFESDHGNGGYYMIVSLGYPSNNGNPTLIARDTLTNDRYPTWLPNGNLLAFIKIPDFTHVGNIYVISTSGGQSRKLLSTDFDPFDNLYPAW